jgi:hypothetical protein
MPNLTAAETADANYLDLTATGFISNFQSIFGDGINLIYIAIRRGPMKVPTTGTSVFEPEILPINSASTTVPVNAGLTTDMVFGSHNSDESGSKWFASRLTANVRLDSTSTAAEASGAYYWDNMVGVRQQETNAQPVWYFMRRAPGYFDAVCYTGTGVARTVAHNLTVAPELIIVKKRSSSGNWFTYSVTAGNTYYLLLNSNISKDGPGTYWNSTTPTASVFSLGTETNVNDSGETFVAYLFATCPGVSKVGSYTGTATTLQINCGFTAGSRFVLIKRTDSTGDWYVWDSARGIVAGNDPYLLLNSTAAEVTSTDYVDTFAAGFELTATAPAAINASGGSYIFLAIA